MEHFIKTVTITKLRNMENIEIGLNENERQHLLLTGKNGSGKTTLLLAIKKYLTAINDGALARMIQQYSDGLELDFNDVSDLDEQYQKGNFITAYFPADRSIRIEKPRGVEDVKLDTFYRITDEPGTVLLKYMVHLKTQQAYARNEGDVENADRIQRWFERFEEALRVLLDDESILLEYSYKEYDFKIAQAGREAFAFDELSDGYSSVIRIVSDLILRMDHNWLIDNELSHYEVEGIVLIDELETHLHIELQKKILPFLTSFFPRIQFIVSTHSPYILNSISNAKVYDLEKKIELEDLSKYSAEGYTKSESCCYFIREGKTKEQWHIQYTGSK